MKWQILIPTTVDRRPLLDALTNEINRQIIENGLLDEVGVLVAEDNREKSVGSKRQDLLEASWAEYVCGFDSDDWPNEYYISKIYEALLSGCDCVGMVISMTTNGINPQICCHSLRYPKWENKKDGYDYVRNVTHFNPILRNISIQVGYDDVRYGEDKTYSDKVTKLCKSEVFIQEPLFNYRYSTEIPHKKKYGINE